MGIVPRPAQPMRKTLPVNRATSSGIFRSRNDGNLSEKIIRIQVTAGNPVPGLPYQAVLIARAGDGTVRDLQNKAFGSIDNASRSIRLFPGDPVIVAEMDMAMDQIGRLPAIQKRAKAKKPRWAGSS